MQAKLYCPFPEGKVRVGGTPVCYYLLLSAKNQKFSNNVSAVPINRYCGFIFQKVSPPLSSKSVASGGDDPDSASIFIQSFSGHSKKEYGFT